jgi:hypothetical protein
MSVRVARNYWFRVLDHYFDVLHAQFLHKPLTPTIQHQILIEFERAVALQRRTETHPIWHVPLIVKFDFQRNSFSIEPVNPADVEII